MENKKNNTGVIFPDETDRQLSDSVGLPQASLANSQALSSDPGNISQPLEPAPIKKPKNILLRLMRRADVALAILLIAGSIGLVLRSSSGDGDGSANTVSSRFETTEIPLQELITETGIDFGNQGVTINGPLRLNDTFVVAPSLQPSNATAGQIYYDQTSNLLNYYNGTEFVPVGGSGASLIQSVGAGLTVNNSQLVNTGVLSLQGQTGNVTLTAGNGIGISGTTISNNGVVSLVSGNSTLVITDNGNGNLVLTVDVGGAGVTSLNGQAGVVNLANASGSGGTVTINDATTAAKGIAQFSGTNFTVGSGIVNTIQNINTTASPTFASVNTNSITPSAALTVGATGQQLTLQGNASTQLTATGGGFTTTVGFTGVPTGAVTYNFDRAATPGTYNICTAVGNCAGVGGSVGGSGTQNRLAKFTVTGSTIGDSTISDNGTLVSTTADLTVQGGDLTVGVAGSQLASLVLAHSNGFATTLQPGASGADLTFILPTGSGNQFQCLKKDTGNQLIWDNCDGGGGGVTSTFQNVYNNSNPAMFTLNATNGGLIIRDNATPIGANLLAVQNSTGATTYFGLTTSALTLGSNVDLLLTGTTAYISNPQAQTNSESFGLNASVTGTQAVAIGASSIAGGDGTAVGKSANAGAEATAIGQSAAAGTSSVALGNNSSASFANSIAIGATSATTATKQLVVGGPTNGGFGSWITDAYLGAGVTDGSATSANFTLHATGGSGSNIAGASLTLAGGQSTGNAAGGNVIIQGSAAGGSGSSLNSLTTIATFAPANVTLGTNVDLLLQGATAYISNPQTQTNSESFGLNASVTGSNALAVGNGATAAGGGVSLGQGTTSVADGVAIGRGAITAGSFGGPVAIGQGASADAWGVAIGSSSATSGNWGTAVGQDSATTGQLSVALGTGAIASQNGVALGADATTNGNNRIAIGYSAAAAADNQMVIGGSTADTSYINHVVIGSGVTDATPQGFTLQATSGSGANIAGANLDIAAGQGTGSAIGGGIAFKTSAAGGAGSTLNGLVTVGLIQGGTGAVTFTNAVNSTSAFNVENSGGGNLFTIDTVNSRVGINLGGNNTPLMDANGLEVNGSIKMSGSGFHTFTTPLSTGLNADFSINVQSVGAFTQVMALGLDSATDATARGILVADARTVTHQPSIAVLSPNESNIGGFSWDGSDAFFFIKNSNSSGALIFDVGGNTLGFMDAVNGVTMGSQVLNTPVELRSGTGTISIGTGAQARTINIGTAAANQTVTVGSTTGTSSLTLQAGSGNITLANTTVLSSPGTGDTATYLCRNTSNQIATCSGAAAGASFVQGGNDFNATAVLGTNDTDALSFETNNLIQATIAVGGATTFQNSANSTSAFRILASTATNTELFGADSTNSILRLLGGNPGVLPSWTTNGNNFASGRFEHGTVTANGYVYVIAGDDNSDVPQSTVYYAKLNANGSVGTWASTTALPSALTELSAVTANGYVYAIGGRNSSQVVQTSVYYAKINSDGTLGSWNTTTVLPVEKTNHTSFAANGYVYAMGGDTSGGTVATIYYAKLNADGTVGAWNTTTALSAARKMQSSVAVNGYVYTVGGHDGAVGLTLVSYAKLNTDGTIGAWAATSALPTARYNGSVGVLNGYIYHMGGEGVDNADVYYAQLNADGTVGTWTQIIDMNAARRSLTTITSNGYVYAIGGEAGSAIATQEYSSPGRVSVGASLDLVGLSGENLAEGGSGGNLTAGNTHIAGLLTVTDSTSLKGGAVINDNLAVISNSNSTAALSVINASGGEVLGTDTVDSIIRMLSNNTGHLSGTAAGQWNTGNTLPAARCCNASVAVNGYVYSLGGADSGGGKTSTVYYARVNSDGSTGTWAATTSLPATVSGTTAATYNGYIYVHGGATAAGDSQDVYYAKPNADGTITAWTTQNNPTNLIDHVDAGMAAHNGYLYIAGGEQVSGTDLRHVYYARINADGSVPSFTVLTDWLPAGEHVPAVTTIANGYLYVFGSANYDKFFYGRIAADGSVAAQTQATGTLSAARRHASIAVMNGYIYAIAGGSTAVNTIQYAPLSSNGDIGTFATDTTTLPATRTICPDNAPVVNGYIYLVGCGDSGFTSVNTVYYASGTRVKVGGSLDLVGYSGEGLSEGGSGGGLTAGNTLINGVLSVTGNANFKDGAVIGNNLTVQANNNTTGAFTVLNATGEKIVNADTLNRIFSVNGALEQNITANDAPQLVAAMASTNYRNAQGIDIQGNYAYIVSDGTVDRFSIVDITNPASPVEVSSITSGVNLEYPKHVRVKGHYAYIINDLNASSDPEFVVYDISNPNSPTLAASIDDDTNFDRLKGMEIVGNYAYVVSYDGDSFSVIDISNPTAPVRIATTATDAANFNGPKHLTIKDKYAYVSLYDGDGVAVMDISDPDNPTRITTVSSSAVNGANGSRIKGKYLYIAAENGHSITPVNIEDPSVPVIGTALTDATNLNLVQDLDIFGDYIVAAVAGTDRLAIVDISTPATPTLLSNTQDTTNLDGTQKARMYGRYIYAVADGDDASSTVGAFSIWEIGGFKATSADIGELRTNNLFVDNDAFVSGMLTVQSGLSVAGGANFQGGGFAISNSAGTTLFQVDTATSVIKLSGTNTGIVIVGASAEPSAPVSGSLRLYAKSVAGRMVFKMKGPEGTDKMFQPSFFSGAPRFVLPQSDGTFSEAGLGSQANCTSQTTTIPAEATTNLRTSSKRMELATAAGADSVACLRGPSTNSLYFWRGNAAGLGGFFYSHRFAVATTTTNQRLYAGLWDRTSNPGTTLSPSSQTNIIGVGWDSADTNLQVMHNDGSGSATKINLGSNFPANNTTAIYDLKLYAVPNGSTVLYEVTRLDTGSVATGTLSTDLPSSTTFLTYGHYINNGGTAAIAATDFFHVYIETDY